MADPTTPREWDATRYHDLATAHQSWGAEVLDRLALRGDETVLDLGCGTGRVTAQLLERLGSQGRVIGVDGSAAMVAEATRRLGGERARFVHQDLLDLAIDTPAGGAVSSATFHWIHDHDRLFARVRAALQPGATFTFQCGGRGNIAALVAIVDDVIAREPFASHFTDWPSPWNFAGPEETTELLERAGFAVQRCWLTESPQRPDDLRSFLRTITFCAHVERLPDELQDRFLDAVIAGMGDDPVHDYVRLNAIATAG
jgi:trans-aconitate 2-methyltransferase